MIDRDASMGPDGLTRRDRDLIRDVLARYPEVRRVTLFGSRAMGTFGRGSDIDLALEGPDLDSPTLTRIATELEDSDLPYKVDLLLRDDQLEPKLEAHIRRYGKPFGWKQTTLGAEVDLLTGFPFKSERYTDSDDSISLLRGDNIVQGSLRWDGVKKWLLSEAAEHELYQLREGDVVLAMDRPWIEAGLKYAAISKYDLPCLLVQRTTRLRGGPNLDTEFLRYVVGSSEFTQHIHAITTGTAVPHISGKQIKDFTFALPPLPEQRDIAGVLGALDDKIEQNRRTAQALERLARAIFRAWFVDFEPVKGKAAGAAAFPSMPQPVFDALPTRFVDSDLGPVPEGWAVKPIATIATFLNGLALQKYPPRGDGEDLRVIKIAELRKGSAEGADCANSDVPDQYIVEDGDLLFSWSGTLEAEFWFGGKGVLNQHLFKVTSSHLPSWFCFLWIRQHLPWFRTVAASKATTMGHIKRGHLQEAQVVAPTNAVLQVADAVIGPLYDLHAQLMVESRKLAEMRDYLLPKLISGELRVKDGAHIVLEATA